MEKKTIKKLTIGALIAVLLSLSFAISPALACNTQNQKIKSIIVRSDLLNENYSYPLLSKSKLQDMTKHYSVQGPHRIPLVGSLSLQ